MRLDRLSNLRELSGSLGDLGILLPLAVALISVNGLSATAVFASAGLTYLIAGWYFGVPIPVQPLKAFAAIAVVSGLGPQTISSGAIAMAAILLLLSLTGLADGLSSLFTKPLIRGIQLAVGLSMMRLAFAMGGKTQVPGTALSPFLLFLVLAAFLFLLAERKNVPAALIVFALGIAIAFIAGFSLRGLALGPTSVGLFVPQWRQLWLALLVLVIPQLPLTLGNSIAATASLERNYFGTRAKRVTPRRLAASLGIANLASGFFGGMPLCHGSGGLTSHYKLGARGRMANVFVGSLCMILALVFGRSLLDIVSVVPSLVLASFLFYGGFQHARLVGDLRKIEELFPAAVIGVVSLLTLNMAVGLAAGVITAKGIKIVRYRSVYAPGRA
jgi:SulP family sulfate permease